MKLAILTDYIPPHKTGGLGKVALDIYSYLKKDQNKKIEPYLITTGPPGREAKDKVFLSANINAAYLMKSFIRLPEILSDFDVVHVHQSVNAFFLKRLMQKKKRPAVFATFHSSKRKERRQLKSIKVENMAVKLSSREFLRKQVHYNIHIAADNLLAHSADYISAVSKKTKNDIMSDYKLKSPIEVIPNGIAPDIFSPAVSAEPIIRQYGLEKKKIILALAAPKISKRPISALLSFKIILKELPNSVLLMAGSIKDDKAYYNTIKGLIRQAGLEGKVIISGAGADDMAALHAAADVVIMPSVYENMPLGLLEAMASGRPVVCADYGGADEVITAGVDGVIVRPDDVGGMSQAAIVLLNDKKRASNVGRAAREKMVWKFAFDDIMKKYIRVYEQLDAD